MSLSSLLEAEATYDGPIPSGADMTCQAISEARIAQARAEARFAAERVRKCLRYARQHKVQGRADLLAIMIRDARQWRTLFRFRLSQMRMLRAQPIPLSLAAE